MVTTALVKWRELLEVKREEFKMWVQLKTTTGSLIDALVNNKIAECNLAQKLDQNLT